MGLEIVTAQSEAVEITKDFQNHDLSALLAELDFVNNSGNVFLPKEVHAYLPAAVKQQISCQKDGRGHEFLKINTGRSSH